VLRSCRRRASSSPSTISARLRIAKLLTDFPSHGSKIDRSFVGSLRRRSPRNVTLPDRHGAQSRARGHRGQGVETKAQAESCSTSSARSQGYSYAKGAAGGQFGPISRPAALRSMRRKRPKVGSTAPPSFMDARTRPEPSENAEGLRFFFSLLTRASPFSSRAARRDRDPSGPRVWRLRFRSGQEMGTPSEQRRLKLLPGVGFGEIGAAHTCRTDPRPRPTRDRAAAQAMRTERLCEPPRLRHGADVKVAFVSMSRIRYTGAPSPRKAAVSSHGAQLLTCCCDGMRLGE